MFLTPETIVLALVFHACGALFVPTIPKNPVISNYRPVISSYRPKKALRFQFTVQKHMISIYFPVMPCDWISVISIYHDIVSPIISIYHPIVSIYQDTAVWFQFTIREFQFTKTLHKLNSLPQPGDFNLPSDVYFRVLQFTVSEFQFTITQLQFTSEHFNLSSPNLNLPSLIFFGPGIF